ncbi:MAG: MFS transporter [bacterium]|nr:MFS transporter [bacterium]
MVNSSPLRTALQLSIIDGALFSVYWSVVAGAIINSLLLSLGAEPMHLAILNGLPSLGAVFALPAARLIQSRDIRKRFVLVTFGLSRLIWLFVPLIVLFPPNPSLQIWFVLLIAAICHTTHGAGGVGWISWVSDLVPEGIRGVYFGTRNALTSLIGMIGVTIASVWADRVHFQFGYSREYLDCLLTLIGISVFFALASWACLYLQPVRKMRNLVTNGWTAIWDSLGSPNGRRIAISWMTFAFSTGLSAGLYTVAMLDRFKITLTGMTSYGWIALVLTTLTTPIWGRIADRFGNKIVLRMAWAGVFWQPLLFVFTPYDMPHVLGLLPITIIVDAIAGGIFWPAVGLAQTNLVIAEAPSQTRAGLFASLGALTGLIAFISVTLGGVITKTIGTHTFNLGIVTLDDIRTVMVAGMILRLLSGILLFRVQEPPRKRAPISTSQAFATMVRLLTGRKYRSIA